MEYFFEKMKQFNKNWNDIPRRAMIIVSTFLGLMILWASFKYLAPLVVALVFSWLVKPLAKPLEKGFEKLKLPRKLGALIALLAVFGALFALLIWLAVGLAEEAREFLVSLPKYMEEIFGYVTKLYDMAMESMQDQIGDEALTAVYNVLMTALNKVTEIASNFAAWLVGGTISVVTKLPDVLLFVLFMIMECYYVVADRNNIGNFFRKHLPEKVADSASHIKDVMLAGVRAQFITALLQMLAGAVILAVGFSIMDLNYGLMLATIIAVLDALPVIGAGLIMFPMMALYVLTGKYMLAVGTLALYLIVQVVKRIMEPKLLGKQMRLSQLATMTSMYAGYVFMGYIGLLIGPLMLKLFIAILSSSVGNPIPVKPEPVISIRKLRRKK